METIERKPKDRMRDNLSEANVRLIEFEENYNEIAQKLKEYKEDFENLAELYKRVKEAKNAGAAWYYDVENFQKGQDYANKIARVLEQVSIFVPVVPVVKTYIDKCFQAIPIFVKAIGDIFMKHFENIDTKAQMKIGIKFGSASCDNGYVTESDIKAIEKLDINPLMKEEIFRHMCHHPVSVLEALAEVSSLSKL